MRTNEAIDACKALDDFIKKDISLPAQVAWDIDDNYESLKKIQDKFTEKQTKILQPLIENKTIKQEEDKVVPTKGHEKDFIKAVEEINDFLETDNDITLKKIKKSQLPKTLSVKDIQALKFIITEEVDD